MDKMNVEQLWYFDDKDGEMSVECDWEFPLCAKDEKVSVKIPTANVEMIMTHRQAKEFAENLMSAVMGLPDKKTDYAGDKTKGDAFEALRRADE